MTQFDPGWLAKREAADHRARDRDLTQQLIARMNTFKHIRALDLGCGTASNARFLSPLFDAPQDWQLFDYDAQLLELGADLLASMPDHQRVIDPTASAYEVRSEQTNRHFSADLADLNQLGDVNFSDLNLVTGSALLDLVSERWLEELVMHCVGVRPVIFFVLNYNGEFSLSPAHDTDPLVQQAVNEHQLTDKGFGPALGPRAWHLLEQQLEKAAYQVVTAPSTWHLKSEDAALQQELLSGWALAAVEQQPNHQQAFAQWLAIRAQQSARGQLTIEVGHQDLLGIPRIARN